MSIEVYFYLFLFFHISQGVTPKFKDVSFTVSTSKILGSDLTIGVFDVEFDQELFLLETQYCLPACKEYKDPECIPCNYAVHGESCGKPQRNESFLNISKECECPDREYCNEDLNEWKTLEFDQLTHNHIVGTQATFFRLYFNKPCHGIHVSTKDVVGRTQFALDYDQGPLSRDKVTEAALFTGNVDGVICPRTPFYTYGTVYLSVWSLTGIANTSILIKTFDTSNLKDVPYVNGTEHKCTDMPSVYCPPRDSPIAFNATWRIPTFFRVPVDKCDLYLVHRELIWTNGPTIGGNGIIFGVEELLAVPFVYYISSTRDWVGTLCPIPGSNLTNYYFTFINLDAPQFTAVMFISRISAHPGAFLPINKIPIRDIQGPGALRQLQGLLQLTCPGYEFLCAPGCGGWPLCCLDNWPVVPSDDLTPLYPIPTLLQQGDMESFGSILYYKEQPSKYNKASFVIFFEYNVGGTNTVPFKEWKEKHHECNITTKLFSEFVNENFEILHETYSIEGKQRGMDCSGARMGQVSQQIIDLTSDFSSLSGSDLYSRRYQIDELTFTEPWQGCDQFAQSFLNTTQEEFIIHDTKACPTHLLPPGSPILKDPCCDETTAWETCCSPRDLELIDSVKTVPQNLETDQCDSICLESLLGDYIFYTNLINAVDGCGTAIRDDPQVTRNKQLQPYRNCKKEWFGEDGTGKYCEKDSHCPSTHCDIVKNVCVYQTEQEHSESLQSFFHCMAQNTPSSIIEYFFNHFSIKVPSSEPEIIQTFLEILNSNFLMTECVSDYGRSSDGTHVLWVPRGTSGCPPCDFICFDEWCTLPIACETQRKYGRLDSVCSGTAGVFISDENGCLNKRVCSIDSTDINSCGGEDQEYMCVVCESPSNCRPVEGVSSEEECKGLQMCVGGDGKIYSGLTVEECQAKGKCSLECENCTQQQCESIGRCSDQDIHEYIESIIDIIHANTNAEEYVLQPDRFCYFPLKPWNGPDCANGEVPTGTFTPYSDGCIFTGNNCNSVDRHWHILATDKESCESSMTCIESNKVYTSLRSPKDEEQCSICEGESVPSFEWTQGSWINGVLRESKWMKKQVQSVNKWTQTIDFTSLSNLLVQAIDAPFTLQLETELYCRINPTRVLLSSIACVCEDGSEEECFKEESIDIGVGKACPGTSSDVIAPPSTLSFFEDSVSTVCVDVSVRTLLEAELKKPKLVVISTSFREIVSGKSPVKNEKGNFVGQTLGNGISLKLSSNNLEGFKLCIVLNNIEKREWNNKYTIFDFGQRLSDEDVRPYGVEGTFENSKLCGVINIQGSDNLSFYPIVRQSNWEENEDNQLNNGEIATYVIMFILYLFAIGFGLFFEIQISFEQIKPVRLVGWFLLVFCGVRAMYFILLAGDVIGTGETNLVDFILIEVPTFLYFDALVTAVMLWLGVTRLFNASEYGVKVKILAGIMFILSIVTVISIVLVWSFLEENGEYFCNGRVYEEPDDSAQKNVQTIYRLIVIILTVLILIFMWAISTSVFKAFNDTQTMKSGDFSKKVMMISIIASLSLLAQCIFFAIYSYQENFSFEWSYLLIPIEIIPILIMYVLIAPTETITQVGRMSRRLNTGGSGTGNSGTGTGSSAQS